MKQKAFQIDNVSRVLFFLIVGLILRLGAFVMSFQEGKESLLLECLSCTLISFGLLEIVRLEGIRRKWDIQTYLRRKQLIEDEKNFLKKVAVQKLPYEFPDPIREAIEGQVLRRGVYVEQLDILLRFEVLENGNILRQIKLDYWYSFAGEGAVSIPSKLILGEDPLKNNCLNRITIRTSNGEIASEYHRFRPEYNTGDLLPDAANERWIETNLNLSDGESFHVTTVHDKIFTGHVHDMYLAEFPVEKCSLKVELPEKFMFGISELVPGEFYSISHENRTLEFGYDGVVLPNQGLIYYLSRIEFPN